ncbi:MAG: protein translocase subunit SecF [Lachnospiraceae bacterium]|nr:protein translocase subunit SecF [Lachnospiraceae bacterium]
MKPGKRMFAVILFAIAAFICVAAFGIGSDVKGVQEMRYGIDIRGGVEAVFEPKNLDRSATKAELDTARDVIEMRLDALNITDREVTVDQDSGYLIVRFPWKSDEKDFHPEDAIAELGEMAQLSFRDEAGNVLVEGKNVKSASPERDTSGIKDEYVVSLTFDQEGTTLFDKATGEMIGKKIGIYMDDQLIFNPTVQSRISNGQASISGMAGYEEAKSLADKINSGALPFSLETTSFSTISPVLGANALHIMILAGLIAFALVCIFMVIYYKLPGVVAVLVLTLQMTLQLLAISVPQYTLTLPGIAGIILSLGMAVDANIIISERISEELKAKHSVRQAVINGYKSGFTSVLDGNITTAIVAVILMIFGSGSMLSFGYTLLVGMIVNVVIGVTVSKAMQLSLITFPKWNQKKWFREKKELRERKFYQKKWICLLISGAAILIGIIGCVKNGVRLDTQFTGGVVMNYTVNSQVDSQKVKETVAQISERAVTVQETKSNVDNSESLEITLAGNGGISPEEQKEITTALQDFAGEGQISLTKTYAVEPYIGAKALKNAGIAIALSFLFIVIYVWIRFTALSGLTAGITALIALLHDVLVVFFVFVLFKIPLNDAFVAVVLTIIGYSINDTIVVYDRIRENRKMGHKEEIITLTNRSISQVLARSVNTSVTTGICVLTILVAAVFFQIDSIREFALPMFFGLVSGCYSSVCIASILWAAWEKKSQKKKKLNHENGEKI